MADVFISYASGDRTVAERIARGLEAAGLSVWWDRHIKGGAEFSRDIEEQLDSARRVLVLWSKEAVNSRWVRDEASVAADSKRLVAATIDGTPAPLGFRQFQTLDLSRSRSLPTELLEALDASSAAQAPARPRPPFASRRVLAIVASIVVLIGALAWHRPAPFDRWLGSQAKDQTVALAIMPFNSPPGADAAWLGAGLSGSLNNSLASLGGLRLVSGTSTQAVAGQRLTAPEIGERLRVSHLVEGDVQKTVEGLAIIVRLIQASDSSQLWTRSYSGTTAQLPALQASMAADLAAALQARLGVAQGSLASNRDVDPRAYEAYLRGVELLSLRNDEAKRREALQQFRLAAATAPDFADAHAGLAYILALSVPRQIGLGWPQIKAEQRRAAARALQIDPRNLLAETARLAALLNFEGEVEPVLRGSEALLRRAPHFGPANYIYGSGLVFAGELAEGLVRLDRVIESDPFNQAVRIGRMATLMDLRNYDAVRSEALACKSRCGAFNGLWYEAMLNWATPEQYAEDYPLLVKNSPNIPPEDELRSRQVADAIILGRPFSGTLPKDDIDFLLVLLEARLGSTDVAFRKAFRAIDVMQADQALGLLNGSRLNFTPEQRADPRYHALFRHPKLVKVDRYRRDRGLLAGLPVFPVKPYTGR